MSRLSVSVLGIRADIQPRPYNVSGITTLLDHPAHHPPQRQDAGEVLGQPAADEPGPRAVASFPRTHDCIVDVDVESHYGGVHRLVQKSTVHV
jgi:hypothetical protein